MAIINQATKELQVKIVYYGPAMGGKTTNLVQVHDHVQTAAGNKGKLVSLATSSDRTLFFDLLPLTFKSERDVSVRLKLFTVPGQVMHNSTRRAAERLVHCHILISGIACFRSGGFQPPNCGSRMLPLRFMRPQFSTMTMHQVELPNGPPTR